MRKKYHTDPVEGDPADFDGQTAWEDEPGREEDGDREAQPRFAEKIKKGLPFFLIYARYWMPLIVGVAALLFSCCYMTKIAVGASSMELSIVRLYFNAFSAAGAYWRGSTIPTLSWFYGLTVAGAIVGILLFLSGMFLAILAAVTSWRAFRSGHESEQSNRMKVAFQIPFANRILFYLSTLLFLVPVLFPEYFSAIGQHLLLRGAGVGDVIYVILNRPLIIVGVLCVLTLVLAIISVRFEKRYKMDMFSIWYAEQGDEAGDADSENMGEEQAKFEETDMNSDR
ncbi:MAG: hypothetical protein E7585_01415 [Ruminococcaceae bacterium]|nr:hypothetical protein [Oscillospiraceae bacterium]